jgi:alkylation response protein AidB-like acyl-CoA dehydrogenase
MDDVYRLPEEHRELQQAIRALALDKIAPRAAEIDETGEFPWDVYEALAASGFHAIHIPEEYGGSGGDNLASCIVIEEVARVCGSSSLIPAVNKLGTTPVLVGGDEAIKARYMPEVASGDAMFSYALSEPEAGSDAASMKSRAVKQGDVWILNGAKRWITNAGVSKYYTVMASTDPEAGARGISAFVVHADDPGFSLGAEERKLGIKGSPTRELYFDNVELPEDRMIGAEGTGWTTAMKTLDLTRICIGAQAVGLAQGALDVALDYAKERKQFGKPIADFQAIQFMLADMAMQIEAARQLTYFAAASGERKDPRTTFLGSAAKCLASDTAMKVTTDVVQILGGYGYVKDYPAERFMRDAKITQIYEGTNQIQRMVMARQILK